MYTLVIIEDEERIRYSLEKLIPWGQMGFQVVGSFSDGMDALKYLKDNPCDAILTDIMMNRMTGLEMIGNLYKLHPQIKIVILSGYSDFAYAQQAIRYKVENYLVKPVDEEELISTFCSVKEQLDFEREEAKLAETETRDLKQMLQKDFFRQLLSGRITSGEELPIYFRTLGMDDIKQENPLFAFEITERSNQDESAQESMSAPLENVLENLLVTTKHDLTCYLVEQKNDCWHLVAIGHTQPDDGSAREHFNQQLQSFTAQLGEALGNRFTYHLTHGVTQIGELLTGTKLNADMALSLPEQEIDSDLYNRILAEYKLFIVELDTGSKDTLNHLLDGVFAELKDTSVDHIQFILRNLYSVIEAHYKKRRISVADITNGVFDISYTYRLDDMQQIIACVKENFAALCDGLKNTKCESTHNTIRHIVAFLDEHISEEIGHEAIAQKYRMHPGYLSRLFKQEMGETLSEYLMRIKTERAALLLKEGQHKVSEIAVMVGYNASSYFSIMFKKNTGYSPREYAQKVSM